ncbi:MAG: zinc finger Ran-binding domain-containing protein [Candidatus Bathyarchaeota archaeon]|nr:zinc finger Ran-binding domain-containing protein [Candidatus Bathyarchaeota archaeon]
MTEVKRIEDDFKQRIGRDITKEDYKKLYETFPNIGDTGITQYEYEEFMRREYQKEIEAKLSEAKIQREYELAEKAKLAKLKIEEEQLAIQAENRQREMYKKMELHGAPKEFIDMLNDAEKIQSRINNYRRYGTTDDLKKIKELEGKIAELKSEMLKLPFKGYSMEFKPVTTYMSVANPEHMLLKDDKGNWYLKGYDKYYKVIEENGKLKAVNKLTLETVFNTPEVVNEEHDIILLTEEELKAKEEQERQEKLRRIEQKKKEQEAKATWVCDVCKTENKMDATVCVRCNIPRKDVPQGQKQQHDSLIKKLFK